MPSSVVRSFGYDPAARRLDVNFTTGRAYSFYDVPAQTYLDMKGAFAKGRFFNAHIRGRYRFEEHPHAETDITRRDRLEPNAGARDVRRDEKGPFRDD